MVHVINDFYIDSDGTQYIMGKLGKTINKKTGEECFYIKSPSYYTSFASALMGISRQMRREAIKGTEGVIKDACEAIKESDEALIRAISVFDDIVIKSK